MTITRRQALAIGAGALAGARLASSARAAEDAERHGISAFGDLKYPPDFKQFAYVNANAPRGGAVRLLGIGTYDNFNPVVEGVKGHIDARIGLIHNTLLTPAGDEV